MVYFSMNEPTKIDMVVVNWNRYDILKQMRVRQFYAVPKNEQCAAWRLIHGERDALMKATEIQ